MPKQNVVGNWKLYGSTSQIKSVLGEIAKTQLDGHIGICVPFPYLMLAKEILRDTRIQVGAQDVSQYDAGAYTGEVSASMLADVGCETVIIAHSERRNLFGVSTEQAAHKIRRSLDAGLFPIYCVGETTEQRNTGKAIEAVAAQLQALKGLPLGTYCVAYEPTWAIGSGVAATPEQISEMHLAIKNEVNASVNVLYGGSVKASNASTIMSIENVDGVLVGGAALSPQEFIEICKAAR